MRGGGGGDVARELEGEGIASSSEDVVAGDPVRDDHIDESGVEFGAVSDVGVRGDKGDGGVVLSSTLSRSPSIGALSSSVDGKKLRKSNSACHLDAFLNSIQTSIRPGRDSAGSRRSRWFVVLRECKGNEY